MLDKVMANIHEGNLSEIIDTMTNNDMQGGGLRNLDGHE